MSRRVFISYAHQEKHDDVVRELWAFLRANGIDARLDMVAAGQRQDWALWTADQIREADVVLCVASDLYRQRAEGRSGPDHGRGVQWEARLVRDAFYATQDDLQKFVPVVLPGQTLAGVPDFLTPSSTTVYTVSDFTKAGAEQLLRLLLQRPEFDDIPLGEPPEFPTWRPDQDKNGTGPPDTVPASVSRRNDAASPSDPQGTRHSRLIRELEQILSKGGVLGLAIASPEYQLRRLAAIHGIDGAERIVASTSKFRWWNGKPMHSIAFTTWGLRVIYQGKVFSCAYQELHRCQAEITREVAWRDPEYPILERHEDFLTMTYGDQEIKIQGSHLNVALVARHIERLVELVRERDDLFPQP
ncbi:toll/interleukin-1 receptor domain-containing protein [Paractinoplanes hotanensis]|uniref:Toll/interleukin-1 receptor domain-containing protein n=1 Tax=Paractinoplanes hotanensis TaxID=2906497 RepID=A0ABT0YFH2_9ACTN|nr:toll/interleukin-1 receptor domain-containing protein [Actinoplanes hotanensis]MCM4084804.1 toll/interleukin-1 receptor domain-containing protein [Actinoplanes hotanensis]